MNFEQEKKLLDLIDQLLKSAINMQREKCRATEILLAYLAIISMAIYLFFK